MENHLREYYLGWLDRREKGDEKAMKSRPNSVRYSQGIYRIVSESVGFAQTDA